MRVNQVVSAIIACSVCIAFTACGSTNNSSASAKATSSEISFPSTYHFDPPPSYPKDSGTSSKNQQDILKTIYTNNGNYTIVKSSDSKYDRALFLGEFKNTSDVQISLTGASMDVADKKGNLLGTIENLNFRPATIEPGQSTFIYEDIAGELRASLHKDYIDVSSLGKETINYNLQTDTDVPSLEANAENVKLSQGDDKSINAIGTINYKASESMSDLYIIIPVRDKSNTIKTVLFDKIDSITANSTKGFTANEISKSDNLKVSALHINKNEIVIGDSRRAFGANIIA